MLGIVDMRIWEMRDPIQVQGEQRRAEYTVFLLCPQRTDSILDVGCGDAYQINYVAKHKSYIVGIDVSHEKLKEGKKVVREANFVCASSESLPFQPKIFNKVMCLELLEHLRNPLKTLDEIDVVLKEKGILVISVPYNERIVMTQCIHCGKLTPMYGHLHSFDEKKLSHLLPKNYVTCRQEGMGTILAAYPIFHSLPLRLWRFIDRLSGLLPGMKPCWLLSKFQKT